MYFWGRKMLLLFSVTTYKTAISDIFRSYRCGSIFGVDVKRIEVLLSPCMLQIYCKNDYEYVHLTPPISSILFITFLTFEKEVN